MLKLVIFDLDGTLIDSEPLQFRAYRDAFRQVASYEISEEDYASEVIIGGRKADWFVVSKALAPPGMADDMRMRVVARKQEIYSGLVNDELQLREGVPALLNELNGKVGIALVSASRMDSVQFALSKFRLHSYFSAIYSCMAGGKHVPKQDFLLKTALELGAKPDECIVIEDSPKGLRAAKAAGMKCVICPHKYTKGQDFSGAELVVESLEEINHRVLEAI